MISILLFEFDKIFTILPPAPIKSIKNICFRPLPVIKWKPQAYEVWQEMKKQKIPVILVAYENEAFVKESVYAAGLCPCFDCFIFVNEFKAAELPHDIIMKELERVYGLCRPYRYLPPSATAPLKLHFR